MNSSIKDENISLFHICIFFIIILLKQINKFVIKIDIRFMQFDTLYHIKNCNDDIARSIK